MKVFAVQKLITKTSSSCRPARSHRVQAAVLVSLGAAGLLALVSGLAPLPNLAERARNISVNDWNAPKTVQSLWRNNTDRLCCWKLQAHARTIVAALWYLAQPEITIATRTLGPSARR